jgi:hypothetical protein
MKIRHFSALALLSMVAACQNILHAPFNPNTIHLAKDGRQYRLEQLVKKPGSYARVGANSLRYFPHATYELDYEDEAFFYVRQYVSVAVKPIKTRESATVTPFHLTASAHYAWQPFDVGLPRSGQWRDGFAISDVNGDGYLDIIFGPARKSFAGPTVFLGNGRGSWSRWAAITFPRFAFDYGGATAADFDGDGRVDVAFGVHLRGLAAFKGNGHGEFTVQGTDLPFVSGNQTPVFSSRKVWSVRWGPRDQPALMALNEGLSTATVGRISDGAVLYHYSDGKWIRALGETRLQRATLSAATSTGTRFAVTHAVAPDGAWTISERFAGTWRDHRISGMPVNAQLTAMAIGESSSDAPSLFAIAWREYGSAAWWVNTAVVRKAASGDWQLVKLATVKDNNDVRALAFARLRAGAALDLVTVNEAGTLELFREGEDGTFTHDQSLLSPEWRAGCQGYDLQTRDLDGDGIDEVIVAFAGEGTALTRGTECTSGGAIQAFKIATAHR